jgi:formylglycine-generating enzyme required for sulfatase activity
MWLNTLNDSIYYDQTEVTVSSWLSFYTWLLENEGIEAAMDIIPEKCNVPETVWDYMNTKTEKDSYYSAPQTHMKLGHFAEECFEITDNDLHTKKLYGKYKIKSCIYMDYPITGVTYEQVIKFCKWRTDICGMGMATFRLPTRTEWQAMVKKGLNENEIMKNEKDSLYKDKQCQLFNYRISKELCNADIGMDTSFIMTRASYIADKNNTYDIFGNVSEMTDEKGISVGGNYKLYANQCHIDSIQTYCEVEIWLGFRCIAVKK